MLGAAPIQQQKGELFQLAYWLDEGWHSWPEIVRAGTAAAGLYSRCGSYIADHATDGLIPAEVARMYGTVEWVQRLVDVGLWTVEGDGYRDERYFPLNPSRAVLDQRRKAAAERQRRKRHGKQPRESRVTPGGTTRVTAPLPESPRPPTGGSGTKRGAAGASAEKAHLFVDDGNNNGWCTCRLPRVNKIHTP